MLGLALKGYITGITKYVMPISPCIDMISGQVKFCSSHLSMYPTLKLFYDTESDKRPLNMFGPCVPIHNENIWVASLMN